MPSLTETPWHTALHKRLGADGPEPDTCLGLCGAAAFHDWRWSRVWLSLSLPDQPWHFATQCCDGVHNVRAHCGGSGVVFRRTFGSLGTAARHGGRSGRVGYLRSGILDVRRCIDEPSDDSALLRRPWLWLPALRFRVPGLDNGGHPAAWVGKCRGLVLVRVYRRTANARVALRQPHHSADRTLRDTLVLAWTRSARRIDSAPGHARCCWRKPVSSAGRRSDCDPVLQHQYWLA